MKVHILLFAILFSEILCEIKGQDSENNISALQRPRPCNIAFKCSDRQDVQWASDGSTCTPIRNPCILASINCDRRNQYLNELTVVGKTACQRLCRKFCPTNYKPVCAYYNGQPRNFTNNCALSSYACLTGTTYDYTNEGDCPTMCECPNESMARLAIML